MNAGYLMMNQQARNLVACLKSGTLLTATVRSVDNSMDTAWISLEFPDIGERKVPVKNLGHVQPGDRVIVQCVPDPVRPQRFVFRMISAT
jgi:hypothetical protein